MSALKKALVLHADHTYLVLFAPGDLIPARTTVTFPLDAHRQVLFRFTIGQMPGVSFDEADFEELVSIDIEDLPPSGSGMVDVHADFDVRADQALYINLLFSTREQQHFTMPMYGEYGPLPLD